MAAGRQCVSCAARRAQRNGWVVARKTSPGFTGGSWGTAREGDVVAIPLTIVENRPDDFKRVSDAEIKRALADAEDAQAARATSTTRKRNGNGNGKRASKKAEPEAVEE